MADPYEGNLEPYAVRSRDSGGRTYPEPNDPLRSPFAVDCHRVIECTSFRRLEGKTQVFASSHHDHFRTRLTHTLEAAQIARCLAIGLRANELLAEAITLAHDLGHPPFGHAGEAALNEVMVDAGGFNHNAHSLRVVDYLEHPFPAFRGLNLTAETRAGLLTHATPYDSPRTADGQTAVQRAAKSVEGQIASIADRIAYNCHDLEDAIGAELVGLEDLKNVAPWQDAYDKVMATVEAPHIHALRRIVLDAMLDIWLMDVIVTSRKRLTSVHSLEQVRSADQPLVALSPIGDAGLTQLEQFLIEHVYQHREVATMDSKGRNMVLALFDAYRAKPDALPKRFSGRIDDQGLDRVICDYIAGMTDRFCTAVYNRLADS